MEIDKSIEQKQEYLRENVLEKGYEADLFADFLVSKRGEEGSDISSWSMNDLRQAVMEFIQIESEKKKIKTDEDEENNYKINDDNDNEINRNEKERNDNEKNSEIKEEKETINKNENEIKDNKKTQRKESTEEKNTIENKIENALPPEIYGIVCPNIFECKMPETTPLSSIENPIITITLPEKKEGGFFSKSYITYLITTKDPNLNVRRRYTDFVWLHETFLKLYPYIVIPPIPKKNKIGVDKFSRIFISKRMRYLEKFLKWLVANPVIKNSKLLYDFLSIEKDEDFLKSKLLYDKKVVPLNLIEFYAPNGKMNLVINKEKETYFQNISDNTINNEILLSNLNFSIKQLKIIFDVFIEKVEDVQKKWDLLFLNSTKYFEDISISNTYEKMGKLFTNWTISLRKQNQLIFEKVREYFKYVKNNFRDMKININNVENVKNDYYKYERFLIYKKEDLFKRGDITKWELSPQDKTKANSLVDNKLSALFKMCAKDTDKCIQRKIYYGYYLNQLIEEYERIREFNGKSHKENQIKFCSKLTEIISEFHNHVAENLTALVVENN